MVERLSPASPNSTGTIEIVLAFDDGYWAPTYATMRSICLSTHHPEHVRFHLLHRTMTPEHQDVIASVGRDYGAALRFINLDDLDVLKERIAGFPRITAKRLNTIVYARLFLGDLIDPALERVLYLDSDIFVRAPLDPFFFMDMKGHAIGAILQPDRFHCVAGKDLRTRNALKIADRYFNAGVMLIDMAQYRQMDFAAALAEVTPAEFAMFYYDQDIINYCFRGRFIEVEPRWNLQNPIAAHEAFDPAILHYSASAKPWLVGTRHVAFKRTYRHLMTNEYYYQYRRERVARMVRRWLRLS